MGEFRPDINSQFGGSLVNEMASNTGDIQDPDG